MKTLSAQEIVIAAGVDKLLDDTGHHECVHVPKRILGLSSPTDIISRSYHWKLSDGAKKFRTAF